MQRPAGFSRRASRKSMRGRSADVHGRHRGATLQLVAGRQGGGAQQRVGVGRPAIHHLGEVREPQLADGIGRARLQPRIAGSGSSPQWPRRGCPRPRPRVDRRRAPAASAMIAAVEERHHAARAHAAPGCCRGTPARCRARRGRRTGCRRRRCACRAPGRGSSTGGRSARSRWPATRASACHHRLGARQGPAHRRQHLVRAVVPGNLGGQRRLDQSAGSAAGRDDAAPACSAP